MNSFHDLYELDNNVSIFRKSVCVSYRKEADAHKRERNVLAHQSTLILQGLSENADGEGCNIILLQEIEDLKRTLEDERNKYEEEINSLQVINYVMFHVNTMLYSSCKEIEDTIYFVLFEYYKTYDLYEL